MVVIIKAKRYLLFYKRWPKPTTIDECWDSVDITF